MVLKNECLDIRHLFDLGQNSENAADQLQPSEKPEICDSTCAYGDFHALEALTESTREKHI